jgi:hypothetical protein
VMRVKRDGTVTGHDGERHTRRALGTSIAEAAWTSG